MRVAYLTSPMVFQTKGGLQVQILESMSALRGLGVCVELIDPMRTHLTEFDLVHVFSAINGNHRIVEHASAFGVPVVTSPLLQPHWTARLGVKGRWLERVVGKVSGWEIKTEYRHIESCLSKSDALIALGEVERDGIVAAFGIDSGKIVVVPNGVGPRFFSATADAFAVHTGIAPGFVLCVASIDSHKNQLTLVHAMAGSGREVVLIGDCLPNNHEYLRQVTSVEGVHYLGGFEADDPLLSSAYAAAGAFCLPSYSEVMPLVVLEALASGTPAVFTRHHCMDTSRFRNFVTEINPSKPDEIRKAIEVWLRDVPSREACRGAVSHLSWNSVGEQILGLYKRLAAKGKPSLKFVSSRGLG